MKYKWRGGIVLALLACAVFLGLRIRSVNMAVELPPEESYEEGEFVEIGDNYFYQEREKNTGYGIKVISSKFVPYADYVAAYGQDETYLDEGYRPEYVLDIELTIRNSNTDEEVGRGFDFVQMVEAAHEGFSSAAVAISDQEGDTAHAGDVKEWRCFIFASMKAVFTGSYERFLLYLFLKEFYH